MWIPGASAEKGVVYLGMVQSWRRKKMLFGVWFKISKPLKLDVLLNVCGRNWILLQQVGLSRVIPHRRKTQRENLLALKIGAIQLPHAPGQHPKRVPININFNKFSKSQLASKIPRYEKPRWMEEILHQLIDGLSSLSHYL